MASSFQPKIYFEDSHLIVLSKPAGLLSQGEESGAENLVDELRLHFGRHYVGLVHRLDRNTSGLMVVAKRSKSALRLTESLKEGTLKRNYLAIVQGDARTSLGKILCWEHSLLKDEKLNIVRVVGAQSPGAKKAKLFAEVLQVRTWKAINLTLFQYNLDTGRSHQIRVQSAFEGFPLVGDSKYGAGQLVSGLQSFGRPALHSATLEFPHPMSHEKLHFEDPLPKDMQTLLDESSEKGEAQTSRQ